MKLSKQAILDLTNGGLDVFERFIQCTSSNKLDIIVWSNLQKNC